jgi:hypothetical protein
MHFLDPKEKRLHSIRLMIGYSLMTVLIFIATLILVYQAYGFGIDSKTGQVIQNGLVYLDSAPDKSLVYINGQLQSDRTNARFALPEGTYTIDIKRDGYRDWSRTIELRGGEIERLTYPTLIQTNLAPENVQNLGQTTLLTTTQSPDRRWILTNRFSDINVFTQFDLKDVKKSRGNPSFNTVTFPSGIFSNGSNQKLEIIDWSNDNQHFLVKHTYGKSNFEFIMLNRDRPDTSFNINKLLDRNITEITLRDKKFDQWYFKDRKGQKTLYFGNAKKQVTEYQMLVDEYKSYSDNVLVFSQVGADGSSDIYLRQNDTVNLIRKVKKGRVMLDISKYDNQWYVAISSQGDKDTFIYKNPWDVISKDSGVIPAPISILHARGDVTELSFATNSRFVLARDGQHFGVYDAEADRTFHYSIKEPIDKTDEVYWMDGHRIIFVSEKTAYYMEFDGKNKQQLVSSQASSDKTVFFDRDYVYMYNIVDSTAPKGTTMLTKTAFRYEQDIN